MKRDGPLFTLCCGIGLFLLFGIELILFIFVGGGIINQPLLLAACWIFLIFLYGGSALIFEHKLGVKLRLPYKDTKLDKSTLDAIGLTVLIIVANLGLFNKWTPKFITEYRGFTSQAGKTLGIIAWILQHLYYAAEMLLCCTILRLLQQAGDEWTGVKWIPWGGIGLGLAWGAIHFISKTTTTGLVSMLLSVLWGIIYIIGGERRWLQYILMLLIFVC